MIAIVLAVMIAAERTGAVWIGVTVEQVLVRGKVSAISQCHGQWLKGGQEFPANRVFGDGPEVVRNAVVAGGQRPTHLDLNGAILHEFGLDLIGIKFEHEEGWDTNVGTGSVVVQEWLVIPTRIRATGIDAGPIGTLTPIVGNENGGCPRVLGIADLGGWREGDQTKSVRLRRCRRHVRNHPARSEVSFQRTDDNPKIAATRRGGPCG